MSSTVNQYLLFGIRLDFSEAQRLVEALHGDQADEVAEKYDDNGYRKEIGHFEGMTYITDGMNGEYAFFGIVKQKSSADDWLNTVSIERAKAKDIRAVTEKAKALLGADFEASPGWHFLTHWH